MAYDGDDLTAAERRRLERLPPEIAPPDGLEDRVLARLRREGLLPPGTPDQGPAGSPTARAHLAPTWVRKLAAAAVVVAGLGVAFMAGRRSVAMPGTEPAFLLALYEGPEFDAFTDDNYGTRYEEYNRWIAELRTQDRFVTGLPLDSTGYVLVPSEGDPVVETRFPRTEDGWVDGLFVIRASDYPQALEVARSAPHVRYRGRIAIRRIAPL